MNKYSTGTGSATQRHQFAIALLRTSLVLAMAAILIRFGPWKTGTTALLGPIWWLGLVVACSAALVGVVVLAPVHAVANREPGVSRRAALSGLAAFALHSIWGMARRTSPVAVASGAAVEMLDTAAQAGNPVTDFGATGDGITDDAPAIQACIDASKPGDCIYFPATGANNGATTYRVAADIRLAGERTYASAMGAPGQSGVEIKYADGVNGTAVLVAAEYVNNHAWCGYPIHISNLRVNGNRAHNSAGNGIVLMNYNSKVEDCYITQCAEDGIRFSDKNAAGTVIANSCVETRFIGNKINNCSGRGIMVLDTGSSGRLTDGYCIRNIVSNTNDDAIVIKRSAGWWISENHVYSCQRDGIVLAALWNTYLVNNEVDGFGAVSGGNVFSGFKVWSILDGRPSVISGNLVSARERAGDGYRYYSIRNAWYRNCSYVQFYDNKLHRDVAASTDAVGLLLAPNGGEMHFYEQGSMLEGLPTTIRPDGKCHRYNPSGQVLDFMETLDRDTIDSSTSSPLVSQGTMYLTYFTANQFLNVSRLTSATRGTAGAGAGLAKMALYELHPTTGDGTCIARTASDPTLWQNSETVFERPIVDDGNGQSVSSVQLCQGRRYAFALLHVGSAINPALAGKTGIAGLVAGIGPATRRSGCVTSQADIPASFSGTTIESNTTTGDYYYGCMT